MSTVNGCVSQAAGGVLGMLSILLLGGGFLAGLDWRPAAVVYGVLTLALAAGLLTWGRLRIEVAGGELRVGRRARLPLAQAGQVTVLDADQTRALRGPRADPAAFLLARPYLPRAVYIAVRGPGQRRPVLADRDQAAGGTGRGDRGSPCRRASRRHARGMITGRNGPPAVAALREDECQTSAETARPRR